VVGVPLEFAPPKYAVIVNALQARIEDGTYPPGSMLPSETQLMNEFGVSRPTTVRAFDYLRQHGWITTQPGKGRFVKARPPEPRGMPPHASMLLADEVDSHVHILDVARGPAPARAAAALEIAQGAPVVIRRRLLVANGLGPVELGITYVPVDLVDGTDLGSVAPLPDSLVGHLAARKGIEFGHATQRISARPATADESNLLRIGRRECVLTALLAVHDQAGVPVFALDVVIPPTRHELEDAFPITQ
jgi:GntR family transcriptional regulator